jgi:hypothetical protein
MGAAERRPEFLARPLDDRGHPAAAFGNWDVYFTGATRCSYGDPGHITYGLVGSGSVVRGYPVIVLAAAPTIITCEPVSTQWLPGCFVSAVRNNVACGRS